MTMFLFFQRSLDLDGRRAITNTRTFRGKRHIQERVPRQKLKRTNATNSSSILSETEFDVKKSHIIAKIKKEAEENLLKEKVLASLNLPPSSNESGTDGETQGKIRRLPPQQCVILKPISTLVSSDPGKNNDDLREPPPIIIPGNPENSIKLLKDVKGINLIEKEIEKHYEQKIPTSNPSKEELGDHNLSENEDNTTAIILTSLSSLEQTAQDKSKVLYLVPSLLALV